MNIAPSQYLDGINHKPTSPDDFIGGARDAAIALKSSVEKAIARGHAPLKFFFSGEPGTGKTALSIYAQHLMGVGNFALQEFNGQDVNVDVVRELSASLHLTHNELFGAYRLITWHEADCLSDAAQVSALTMIDRLPNRTALICTSNLRIKDITPRFQTRFKLIEVRKPTALEIQGLLLKWPVPEQVAQSISVNAHGNVRVAMLEAEEWLDTQPEGTVAA